MMPIKNYPLAFLRIYLGCIFALAVYPKWTAGASYPNLLHLFLANFAMQNSHQFYQNVLTGIVLPHIELFAVLIRIAETCVAIALISGTATRFASLLAMFLLANYMFSKGLWWWHPASNDGAFFAIAFALMIGAAGRTFGIDSRLAARWPRVPLW